MKKILQALILTTLIFRLNVYAACTDNNLISEAKKVTVSHEEIIEKVKFSESGYISEHEVDPDSLVEFDKIQLSVSNITENMVIKVSNDRNKKTFEIKYSDTKDGIYTFVNDETGTIYNYTFKIYGTSESCKNESVRTIKHTKPRLNQNYYYTYCQENPDDKNCKKYVSTEYEAVSEEKFAAYVEKKQAANNQPGNETKDPTTTNNNIYYIIGAIVIIGIGIVIYIVTDKKRSKL